MPKEYEFARLIFRKDIIKRIYEYPGFSYILFRWKILDGKTAFGLSGISYDDNGNELPLNYIVLEEDPGGTKKLESLTLGILVLSREVMQAKQMNGSEDVFFKPEKYKDGTGSPKEYVAYNVTDNGIHPTVLTSFELNPSPPR